MVLCRLCGRSSQDRGAALALVLRRRTRVWRQGRLRIAGLGQLLRGRLLVHGGGRFRRTLRHRALAGLVGRDGPGSGNVGVARARQAVRDGRHNARERAAGLSLRCRRRLGYDGSHGGEVLGECRVRERGGIAAAAPGISSLVSCQLSWSALGRERLQRREGGGCRSEHAQMQWILPID
jgi:hypothetical protein